MEKNEVGTVLGCNQFGSRVDFDESVNMVKLFLESGNSEFDNAILYARGKAEEMMGKMEILKDEKTKITVATKANPWNDHKEVIVIGLDYPLDYLQSNPDEQYENNRAFTFGYINETEGLKPHAVVEQLNSSLERLQRNCVGIFYLHFPDHNTDIGDTLKAVHQLHTEGKFKEFGLSNYKSWEVAEIYYLCQLNGYIKPTVYQGMYNYVTRDVERELFPCLRRLGIRFYAYNPLAGGLLTGKYCFDDKESRKPQGRFFGSVWEDIYMKRYWKKPLFDCLEQLKSTLDRVYGEGKVSPTSAAIRWLYHHSKLSGSSGDAVLLGASNSKHLSENLTCSKEGPLHEDVVAEMDKVWEMIKSTCPNYFK